MFKKARIMAFALTFALAAAQPARADILITPLDTSHENGQDVQQPGTEQQVNQQPGMGQQQGPDLQPENGPQPQAQTGPGFATASPPLVSSGSYSTKEPVNTNTVPQAETPGAGSQTGPGMESQAGPQVQEPQLPVPQGEKPQIEAQAGILYDATNDRVLFEKNADTKLFPASITKLMTAILVVENTKPNEIVTYSKTATTNLESGAVTLSLTEGDQVSVLDSMYGLLLRSANEVANGLAEHVGGSIAGFADMMNAKAQALGCTNTHFVNPNGLNNPDHYTTCRDMAKIAKAAYANETICRIGSTLSYKFPATKNASERTIAPGHKMLYPNDSRYYEGIVGGKTGYTSLAGNTLVTCVERNGMRLIAVVMKANGTHYTDTKKMLDYGFSGTTSDPDTASDPNSTASYNRWIQDGEIWRFEFANGTRAANCLITVDGKDYLFDAEGRMLTGWQVRGDDWYYFETSGAMAKNEWKQDAQYWFYLGSDGRMVRNAWIDNQYYVGADGAWITGATK